jgi:2-polyprenyl-3-methyl-5-hydroxy-6-metoxy-1,4-benzoquinol methylase
MRALSDVAAAGGPQGARSGMFRPVAACWVCGARDLTPYHTLRFDLDAYRSQDQDHELAEYTNQTLSLVRCAHCGFGQPAALPTLDRYFDRMYDQRWDERWVVQEFEAEYKDFIFRSILRELDARLGRSSRRLLDVGAHAGRFLHLARLAGWDAEGIELNPRTAAYAAARTGAVVHQMNAQALADRGRRYDAIVLTDVLEHIPDPLGLLKTLAALTSAGAVIAVKVPCGPSQVVKERVLAAISSHRVTLADNLVHVNHFSPGSLRLALERDGFAADVEAAAPELRPWHPWTLRGLASNAVRLGAYGLARLPGAVRTPLALHLQAYGLRYPLPK